MTPNRVATDDPHHPLRCAPGAGDGVSDPISTWTEASLVLALRTRYPSNEWALVTQVRDGAGLDRRTFDAVAIGLWGSRGHPVHGFECKVSKNDWKRELAKPEKAEPLVAFCNYWWTVAPKGIVDPWTLPDGWGLLEAHPNGTIHTVREAPRREAKPPTMGFVAQLAKRLIAERPATAEIEAADKAGYERGQASSASNQSYTAQQIESERDDLRERIRVFEEASGLSLDFGRYDGASLRDYAATVRLVVESQGKGWEKPLARLRNARDAAQRFLERTDELIGESTLDLSA